MASRYVPIWEGHEEVLANAKQVMIVECLNGCDVEWNAVFDPGIQVEVDDENCPECGQPGTVVFQ